MKEIIGKRLRMLREVLGVSQESVAEKVGVKQSSVNRYENCQACPSYETLVRYADYFDVSLDYIFARTDKPQGKTYEYRPKIAPDNAALKQFVDMVFDPASPMNEKLKDTLFSMLSEVDK